MDGFASVHAPVAVGEGKERTFGETFDVQFAAGGGSRAITDEAGTAGIRPAVVPPPMKAGGEPGYWLKFKFCGICAICTVNVRY